MQARQRLVSESETEPRRALPEGYASPTRASHYLIRLFLACFGLSYFYFAGRVRETLPLSLHAVFVMVACYALANGILLLRRRAAARFTSAYVVVLLDLAMLAVIVLQDPYPASPVTILLLSAAFDLGQRFAPRVFTLATALALCILAFNLWVRLRSGQPAMSPDGIWLTLSIGALMIYFYSASLAANAARAERRRTAAQLAELRQREQQGVEAQLRMARFSESLRAAAMHPVDFDERMLAVLVMEAGACAAVLHELIEDGSLRPAATYAMDLQQIGSRRIAMGEGLVGACAQHRKAMVLHEVPPGYFELVSGLGRGAPPHLYLMPLGFSTQLAGVLEFATIEALQESELSLLERMLEAVAGTLLVIPRGPSQPEPHANVAPTGGTS
ncbi:GAF domain-containing protein [Nevskia soli]|uniref:GAF domain-containing protein n=1 Tax=Nevskia soli TaxID=418856 RepID=UPI0004A734AC|nr:GAF domain-containing protein [Nevskia soli]